MKVYIGIILLLCTTVSCDKMLDFQNDGRITLDEAFDSRVRVQGYLNSCYSFLRYPALHWASYSDEAEDSNKASGSRYVNWYNGLSTAASFGSYSPDNLWSVCFQGIRRCNIFIENISGATSDISDENKAGMEAQARTLRAFYYLQLIKRYGGVPILSESLLPDHDYGQDRRASFSEVVTFILDECDRALSVPATRDGFPWEVYNNQYGIMTRAVAYAIKSQAVTYAASPLWSDGTYTWAEATEINKEALSQCLANDYSLFTQEPNPADAHNAYALYFISTSNDQRSVDKETIMRGNRMLIWQNAGLPTTTGMEAAGPSPGQELIDSYEMQATGLPPITGYTDADRLQPVIDPASGYDSSNPYEGRDPRFYASIYYNGAARTLDSDVNTPTFYNVPISPEATHRNHLDPFIDAGDHWDMEVTGHDPWTRLMDIGTAFAPVAPSVAVTLEFQYKSTGPLTNPQIFYAMPPLGLAEARSFRPGTIPAVSDWTNYSIDLAPAIENGFGVVANHYLRVDWGSGADGAGTRFQVRNIRIRVEAGGGGTAGGEVETYVGGNEGISELGNRFTVSGYYIRKFNNHRSDKDNDADGENRTFRLAELYLNFAESAYQAHGPDAVIDLGSGISMSARDAANAVRARAGMPDFPAGMSAEDFEQKYRNERRIEFAFEGHRFFDVRRWKILSDTDRFVTGMRISQDAFGDLNYQRFRFNNRETAADKYLMYPIPQGDVNKIFELSGVNWQNPGWN